VVLEKQEEEINIFLKTSITLIFISLKLQTNYNQYELI
jgi:hypothetical protein